MRITLNLATRPFTDLGAGAQAAAHRHGCAGGALRSSSAWACTPSTSKAEAPAPASTRSTAQIARITRGAPGYQAMMQQPDNAQLLDQAAGAQQALRREGFLLDPCHGEPRNGSARRRAGDSH